jgi:HCOMODA/2-hydroxy-3-carboxy-muconic semialdehyde decarboxylase
MIPNVIHSVAAAARVLAALGLVDAFGHVSARHADALVITPAAPLADARAEALVTVPLDAVELPAAAPAETWLHLAVYRERADVAAVTRAQPVAALAVGASAKQLPAVFGQAAWLGAANGVVPVHPVPRLLRSPELAREAAATLAAADAMVLRGNGAVTVGTSPGIAVARMHVLDTACRVWAQAPDTVPLDPADVEAWRLVAPALLDRLWHHLSRSDPGEIP